MTTEHYIEEQNLSLAWARALQLAVACKQKEVAPLIVSITGFDKDNAFCEEPKLRQALDAVLETKGKQSVETVANTIFPRSLWNPAAPRQRLFERYFNILPRLRRASRKNCRGLYFERMITGGPPGKENQLEFALNTFTKRPAVRRSALQIGVFQPAKDHSEAAQVGFPCLQHVTFAPTQDGLCLNAFYASQYLVERAYGNYVGLCRLGQFIAHELGRPLSRVTCYTGIAICETEKSKLAGIFAAAKDVLKPATAVEAAS